MSKISDERREVAARLREHDGNAHADVADMCDEDLADLIDPTCEMTDASWDNGECTWGCICSACDAHIEHEKGRFLDYCPHCGARVVDDE